MTDTLQASLLTELRDLRLDQLRPAEDNIRRDVGDVTELAASIRELGVLQPLVVAPLDDDTFLIIAGHRRHAGAVAAELELVPCIVKHFDETQRIVAMLVENTQRSDVSPIEEADAFKRLIDLGLKQRDIQKRTGRSQSHISKRCSLNRLPTPAREALHSGRINIALGEQLAKIRDDAVVAELVGDDGMFLEWKVTQALEAQLWNEQRQAAVKQCDELGILFLTDESYAEERDDDNGGPVWRVVRDGEKPEAGWFGRRYDYDTNKWAGGLHLLVRWQPGDDADDDDGWQESPEDAAKRAAQMERIKAERERREAIATVAEQRRAFIEQLLANGLDAKVAMAHVLRWNVGCACANVRGAEAAEVAAMLGLTVEDAADGYEDGAAELQHFAGLSERGLIRANLAIALTEGERDLTSWNPDLEMAECHFGFLARAGYELGDIETSWLEELRTAIEAQRAANEVTPDDAAMDPDTFIKENDIRDGDEVGESNEVTYDLTVEPWEGYDTATVEEVVEALQPGLVPGLLRRVVQYEAAHGDRPGIALRAINCLDEAVGEEQ